MNSYLFVKVDSKNINRFLLKCHNNNINIIKIKYLSYKSIVILINSYDLKKINKIKGISKIRVLNEKGLIKYKDLIRNNLIFIISFFIGIIVLLFLSNIIFDIRIEGDNYKLNNNIKKELSNYGIDKYKFKKSYTDINIIKEKVLKKYNNSIEWIEIKENGVSYIVNIVERKINKDKSTNGIYSIVAKRNGIIRGIYTYKGISLVEKGNYVTKGDILISSDLMLNDEVKDRVSAEGKVYAETWYKVNISYPLNYYEKKYTSKKKKIIYLKIGNKYFEPFKYNYYDRNTIIKYKSNISGLEFGIEEIRNINIINKKYSEKDALNKAIDKAKYELKLKLNKDEKIMNQNTLNFYTKGSKIIVDIFFSVYEEIGEKKIIETGEANDTENIGERIQ